MVEFSPWCKQYIDGIRHLYRLFQSRVSFWLGRYNRHQSYSLRWPQDQFRFVVDLLYFLMLYVCWHCLVNAAFGYYSHIFGSGAVNWSSCRVVVPNAPNTSFHVRTIYSKKQFVTFPLSGTGTIIVRHSIPARLVYVYMDDGDYCVYFFNSN